MADISTKPYLIRAIHEWCTDSGYRPYIAVVVDEHTVVPREFVRNSEIVLNVSSAATNRLRITNELIEFEARFGGVPRSVSIPISNVSAIYAQETGHGMAFEVPKALALAPSPGAAAHGEGNPAETSGQGGSEGLREVDPVSSEGSGTDEPSSGTPARRSTSHSRRPRLAAVPSGKHGHTGSDGNGKGSETLAKEGPDGAGSGRIESGQGSDGGTGGDKDLRPEGGKGKPVRRGRKDPSDPETLDPRSGTGQGDLVSGTSRKAPIGKTETGASEATGRGDANGNAAGIGLRKAAAPSKKASQPGSEETSSEVEKGDRLDEAQGPSDDEPPSPPAGRPRLRRVK